MISVILFDPFPLQYFPSSNSLIWLTYPGIILVIFIFFKAVNNSLHNLFDCTEMIEDIVDGVDENHEDAVTVASAEVGFEIFWPKWLACAVTELSTHY